MSFQQVTLFFHGTQKEVLKSVEKRCFFRTMIVDGDQKLLQIVP